MFWRVCSHLSGLLCALFFVDGGSSLNFRRRSRPTFVEGTCVFVCVGIVSSVLSRVVPFPAYRVLAFAS